MSNKRAQSYKKRTKRSQKSRKKKITVQSDKNTIGECQRAVFISIEEILERIAASERRGDLTHAQAFELAERYANTKADEIIVPKEAYDSWTDCGHVGIHSGY